MYFSYLCRRLLTQNLIIMSATIIKAEKEGITVQVFIPIPEGKENMSMLEREELIQQGVNQAGQLATEYALSRFDTDGSSITVKEEKHTSKGQVSKSYQTPYGEIVLCRHVYQTNAGGCTFCPLDNDARIITGATPKLAKMVSSKYSETGAIQVQKDLEENHGRHLSKQYIQSLSQSIGSLIAEKKNWNYDIDVSGEHVKTVGISLDGACMLMCNEGYRVAMVGSISLYYFGGERLYTRYTALPPEYGKEQFYKTFDHEIKSVRILYPNAAYVGIADGAADNWTFLQSRVDEQILDFFHASEYLSKASKAAFKSPEQASQWLQKVCHTLKEEKGGAELVLSRMKEFLNKKLREDKLEIIQSAITYFTNHLHQMNYYQYRQNNYPIGSGVIEAACKVIVKQRLCNSGMKWTDNGARTVLALRCFNKSDGMWKQFWNKINRYGK
jgi:hypothetical protein